MRWGLGGAGPPWYMEGMAELLATHRWQEGTLTLGYFPRDKNETPHWGRIKIIREDLAANRGKTLEQIMEYDERAHLQVEPYAWCWAAATFFDGQVAYRDRFRSLRQHVAGSSTRFAQAFADRFESEWPDLSRQWQVFVFGIDYGYDLDRERIEARPVQPLPEAGATVALAVDRGWQSSGYRLEKGTRYALAPQAGTRSLISRVPGGASRTASRCATSVVSPWEFSWERLSTSRNRRPA